MNSVRSCVTHVLAANKLHNNFRCSPELLCVNYQYWTVKSCNVRLCCSISINSPRPRQQMNIVNSYKGNVLARRGIRKSCIPMAFKPLPQDPVMNVFDREAKTMQRERAAVAEDVAVYDYLKDEIGYRLADRIFDIKRKFARVVDLGCGRGYVAKNVDALSVGQLVLCDGCSAWLDQTATPHGVAVERLVVDEERLPFAPNSVDLVVSCLSLHWVNDLPGTFRQVMSCLKKDGVFLACVFGGDSLYELRGALQLAGLEREGGVAPHISPFAHIRDVGSLLTRAGFTMQTVDTDEIRVEYPSMMHLLHDLKGMGEGNAARNRKLRLNRDTLLASAAIYQQLYGRVDKGVQKVPATFQVIYLLGWKPDESQPTPRKRGSGDISLKDISRLDEIIAERWKEGKK